MVDYRNRISDIHSVNIGVYELFIGKYSVAVYIIYYCYSIGNIYLSVTVNIADMPVALSIGVA